MAGRILCVDSISLGDLRDRGKVVSSGSHGGVPAGETAAAFGPRLALFNDAGFGMEHAGVAGLAILDRGRHCRPPPSRPCRPASAMAARPCSTASSPR